MTNAKREKKIRSGHLTRVFSEPKRGRNCYATLVFSGIPNAKRRDKIRSGVLIRALSAENRAE